MSNALPPEAKPSSSDALWSGRFSKATDALVFGLNQSLGFDWRLWEVDIEGSIAHVTMLGNQSIIPQEEAHQLVQALQGLKYELGESIGKGENPFAGSDAEDIHSFIEWQVTSRLGDIGKKIHTGRSRNDQVALDLRLYLRQHLAYVEREIRNFMDVLLTLSEQHLHTLMPGFTHLQPAQPITFAHHLMAYVDMLSRDRERVFETRNRLNVSPLGSGALAGTSYPLDRQGVATMLGCSAITQNSLDGVSDRDFVLDTLYTLSVLMMHLSRLSEEVILWASPRFGWVTLDDGFSTGSSMMPQKKNPDVAELVRGKTGRVYGHLTGLLTTLKGLPLAYNKDMQEDKEAVFDALHTLMGSLPAMAGMVETMTVHPEAMAKAAQEGFLNATDVADYLVQKGVPFRDAHHVSAQLVQLCLHENTHLEALPLSVYQKASPHFAEDLFEYISLPACISRRSLPGGPAPVAVQKAIEFHRNQLNTTHCYG